MAKVLIQSESRFLINRESLRKEVEKFLVEKKIKNQIEVSLSIVGDRKMRALNKKYRQHDHTTPVLTFSLEEGKPFVTPPDRVLRIGDIIISYPQAVLLAGAENKLVDQKIGELVYHGLSNLFGLGE